MKKVYVVVPTFNRRAITLKTLARLMNQSFANCQVIVVDGGSSDGTIESVRRDFPQVTLISPPKSTWWGGSVALGIEHAFEQSDSPDDFVLLLNDDTEFEHDLVTRLVECAQTTKGAVAAHTRDAADRTRILDTGVTMDWPNYAFLPKLGTDGTAGNADTDFLPGRATIYPIWALKKFGNVDCRRYPHYLADYELAYRMKQQGLPLYVSYETAIYSYASMTRNRALSENCGMRKYLRSQFFIGSANNLIIHLRFVQQWCPKEVRWQVVRALCWNSLKGFLKQVPGLLKLKRLVLPPKKFSEA